MSFRDQSANRSLESSVSRHAKYRRAIVRDGSHLLTLTCAECAPFFDRKITSSRVLFDRYKVLYYNIRV